MENKDKEFWKELREWKVYGNSNNGNMDERERMGKDEREEVQSNMSGGYKWQRGRIERREHVVEW